MHNEAPRAYYKDTPSNDGLQVNLIKQQLKSTKGTDIPSLDHGKDVIFINKGTTTSTLTLNNNINQGAGSLHFLQGDYVVKGKDDITTWVGGGINTAAGTNVTWQLKGVNGDRLSKVGN